MPDVSITLRLTPDEFLTLREELLIHSWEVAQLINDMEAGADKVRAKKRLAATKAIIEKLGKAA